MGAMVRYAVDGTGAGRCVTITLCSDANRNALSARLLDELLEALRRAESAEAHLVLLTAEGRAFCAGADLGEALREGMAESARRLASVVRAMLAHPLPIVARVHGPVRAGGLGLLAACDLAVAADDVTYAFTEARLGLAPSVISLAVLPRMSPRIVTTAFLTASTFGAQVALDGGLITHSAPPGELDAVVDALVGEIVQCEPQGLVATKRLLNADRLRYLDERREDAVAVSTALFASETARGHFLRFLPSGRSVE